MSRNIRRTEGNIRINLPTDARKGNRQDPGCGADIVQYLSDLSQQYSIMKNWNLHPEQAILEMVRVGNLEAIRGMNCICDCITDELWQQIANTAAQYGHMDIIVWVNSNKTVNWQSVAFHARDAGHEEIAAYSDGYEYVIDRDWSDEFDEFPINLSGPTGDPVEDRGEWIFDWRLQDFSEDFLPDEPLYIEPNEETWEEPDNFTPFQNNPGWGFRDDKIDAEDIHYSEFEEDEDEDRIYDRYTNDIYPAN